MKLASESLIMCISPKLGLHLFGQSQSSLSLLAESVKVIYSSILWPGMFLRYSPS